MTEVAAILTYLVDESAKFHAALAGAVAKWAESGSVPPALLAASKKRGKGKGDRAKRAPSGYTLFVTQHIANLKKEGVATSREKGKDYMSLAGAKWKTMSDAAKEAYNTQAKAEAAAAAAAGGGAGAGVPAIAGGSGDAEKKKKKKKKRDHEGGGDDHKKHKKHKHKHHSDSD